MRRKSKHYTTKKLGTKHGINGGIEEQKGHIEKWKTSSKVKQSS